MQRGEHSTVGSRWVAVYTLVINVGQVHLNVSENISGRQKIMLYR